MTVILRWIEVHGEAFRVWAFLGEPRLLVTDPVALDYIFVKKAYEYPKHPSSIRLLGQLMGPGLIVAEGEQHKRQKLTLQKGFAPASAKMYHDVFTSHAARLRDRLLESVEREEREVEEATDGMRGVKLDVLRPVSRASLDILGQAGFGHDFGALSQPGMFGRLFKKGKPSSNETNGTGAEKGEDGVSSHPLSRAFDSILSLVLEAQGSLFYLFREIVLGNFPALEAFGFGALSPTMQKARDVLDHEARLILDKTAEHQRRLHADLLLDGDDDELGADEGRLLARTGKASQRRNDILATLMRANANSKRLNPHSPAPSALSSPSSSPPLSPASAASATSTSLFMAAQQQQISSLPPPRMPSLLSQLARRCRSGSFQRQDVRQAALNSPVPMTRTVMDKASLSDEELMGQMTTLMFAGHETTSVQTTWLLLALARNVRVQDKLRKEIRDLRESKGLDVQSRAPFLALNGEEEEEEEEEDDSSRELTYEEIQSLKYLDNVVNEGLRRYGAIHTTSRMATKSDVIPVDQARSPGAPKHGVRIEPGTLIIVPIEAIGRLKSLWGEDADEFRPERWDDDEQASMEGKRLYTKAGGPAFLLGPRACIGNRFGEHFPLSSLLRSCADFPIFGSDRRAKGAPCHPG